MGPGRAESNNRLPTTTTKEPTIMIIRKTLAAAALTLGALTAIAAPAAAVNLDAYDTVRYMVCGDGVAEISYIDVDGNFDEDWADLSQGCWFYDMNVGSDGYGYPDGTSYASVIGVDDNGGHVSCTVWVNGHIEADVDDTSDYYSWASCD
ncbi:membrane protein [Gordonia phage APunk]|uniref:Membrane protein n=1 Tax=Gordonia phage APunk TaxID=2926082 RepID=A0A976UAM3_9CAUD|nr:membrane protein [Gordonia phage APunk]